MYFLIIVHLWDSVSVTGILFMEKIVRNFSLERNSFIGNALNRKTKTTKEKEFHFYNFCATY